MTGESIYAVYCATMSLFGLRPAWVSDWDGLPMFQQRAWDRVAEVYLTLGPDSADTQPLSIATTPAPPVFRVWYAAQQSVASWAILTSVERTAWLEIDEMIDETIEGAKTADETEALLDEGPIHGSGGDNDPDRNDDDDFDTDTADDAGGHGNVVFWALSSADLFESIRSRVCPVCGSVKRIGLSICSGCRLALPGDIRKRLNQRLGAGYEEAMRDVFIHLEVAGPTWPAPLTDRTCDAQQPEPVRDLSRSNAASRSGKRAANAVGPAAGRPAPNVGGSGR